MGDEISANVIHYISQDSIGFVWLATDKGIVKFDGERYTQYDLHQFAPNNEFYGISKDTNGVFWFFSSDFTLVRYNLETDSFVPFSYNHYLIKNLTGIPQKIYWGRKAIFIQSNSTQVWEIRIADDGSVSSQDLNASYRDKCMVLKTDNDYEFAVASNSIDSGSTSYFLYGQTSPSFKIPKVGAFSKISFSQSTHYNWTFNNAVLAKISKSLKLTSVLNLDIHQTPSGLFAENDSTIWVGTYAKGAYKITSSTSNGFKVKDHFLKDKTITSFSKGKNDLGVWISSLDREFFYIPLPSGLKISSDSGLKYVKKLGQYVVLSEMSGQSIVFNTSNNSIQLGADLKTESFRTFMLNDTLVFSSMLLFGKYWIKDSLLFKGTTPKSGKSTFKHSTNVFGNEREAFSFFTHRYENCVDLKFRGQWRTLPLVNVKEGFRDFTVNVEGEVFYTTSKNNLGFINIADSIIKPFDEFQLETKIERPIDVEFISENEVSIVASDGIYFWNKKKPSVLDTIFYSPTLEVKNAKLLDHQWWLATDDGLRLVFTKDSSKTLFVNKDLKKNTIINDFFIDNSRLYLATDNGLIAFDTSEVPAINSKPFITSIKSGDVYFKPIDKIEIEHSSANLSIKWTVFDYSWRLNKRYRWRLNQSASWQYSNSSSLDLSALSMGSYLLEVQFFNRSECWSDSSEVAFKVLPPYYFQWWNLFAFTILLTVVIVMSVKIRINQVNKSFLLKESLLIAQSQALSAQLNPHFIFNSMNTVSSFIAQEDDTKALRYISKLSVLLRRIFANSQLASISLTEELQSVKEYVEIEQLRFGKKLKFHFENKAELDLDTIQTPAMLIQPFVENAIKHAVLKSENGGNIWLTVTQTQTNVCVTIEDDGPGLTEQDLFERANQGTSSISAIQKRLDIMKSMKQESATLTVEQGEKGAKIKLSFIKPNL